ncbi:MAG: hypothetical protein A2687_04585 [Candidatus Levybacteria bacterium RIFCSPHIGHO2_01_FULL_38_26]|nr:MAG: hypothetical protein A2687_04585 [Candidatus Levybacteria bacterium RIFCSPHIGHO2_01_FULL_38_26]
MIQKKVTVFLSLFILIIISVALWQIISQQRSLSDIENFEECQKAGYAISESYPAQCHTPDGNTFIQYIGNELEKQNLIRVSQPRPNTLVSNPLSIQGEARGTWFFEANFPVRLIDENGVELGIGIVQAEGEWMTEDFVPFNAEITFSSPPSNNGTLILEKSNPSGLPEHADQLHIPISFE